MDTAALNDVEIYMLLYVSTRNSHTAISTGRMLQLFS